jgi:hypothetical protein
MAYTTLPTQSAGQTASAAGWANVVKANFDAMGPHLINRKTADQSVTSSTTLVDATTMTLPVGASEVWQFEFDVIYSAGNTGDIKFAFTFPAAGRIDATVVWVDDGGSTVLPRNWSGTTTPTSSVNLSGFGGAGTRPFLPIQGIFTNSVTAGNLQLQFAQVVSDATSAVVYANSTVWGVKLA